MVWFQCEDCGENLKKPKLPNHFRCCSAYKLSCIDCGEVFDKHSVQSHTQCITEAEKYGPKGQGKAANGTPAKAKNDKPKPEVDINVGLSDRPPWFCSLCNTKATSRQTLLLHADGKKHRAKARAFHAANQPTKSAEESTPSNNDSTQDASKSEVSEKKEPGDTKDTCLAEDNSNLNGSAVGNGSLSVEKKRKLDATNGELNGGEVEEKETSKKVKKPKNETVKDEEMDVKKNVKNEDEASKSGSEKEVSAQKIKWKKLIKSALKSTQEGALKMKKLQKCVRKALQDIGIRIDDDDEFTNTLEHKVKSSSKFTVDGKYVRLAAKS